MSLQKLYRDSCILLLFFFFTSQLFAQTKFDEKGKLSTFVTSNNTLSDIFENDYDVQDKSIKESARDVLRKKVVQTLKIYQDPTYKPSVLALYERLWPGQSAAIIDTLKKLRDALKDPTPANISVLHTDLRTAINDNLLSNSKCIFYSDDFATSKKTKVSFYKRDPFNGFVVDYYNKNIPHIPTGMSVETKIAETQELKLILDLLTDLLKKGRALSVFDKKIYLELVAAHESIVKPENTLKRIISKFDSTWYKNWFWFRGGQITLNPLDFTTAEFIASHPEYDVTKSNLFNEYIDTLINRQIKYDTVGRINEFIQKLKLKGSGQTVFNFKEQNDSLTKLNENRRVTLLATAQLLNKVLIPKSGIFYNFSAITDQKFDIDKKSLKEAIHTDDNKTIVLHNILQSSIPGLIESDKPFSDKSTFQEGFDTVVAQLGELAALASKFTPYASVIDFFSYKSPVGNSTVPFSTLSVGTLETIQGKKVSKKTIKLGEVDVTYYTGSTSDQLYRQLGLQLSKNKLLDTSIFNDVFPEEFVMEKRPLNEEELTVLNERLKIYFRLITTQIIQRVQSDSIFINQLLQIYNQSTLPELDDLEPAPNKNAVYYSKILETKESEQAVIRTVEIYTVKEKTDTNRLDKFSYKVGKTYRFRLGAGVAYTLNSYDQSEVKEENGQITVENNVQQYRFVVGLHYYFGKRGLFMQDSHFCRWRNRNSIFVGVGIPDPLGNIYLGLNHDLVPGLQLTAGMHIAKNNKYFIQNNVVLEETLRYQVAGPFIALMIDPAGLLNLLNVFKKQ